MLFSPHWTPLCRPMDLIKHIINQSACQIQAANKTSLCPTQLPFEKKVSYWFVRACNTQVMHERPEPVALWGNLVTEFLTRDISDGLLRLPWLGFWNYTVSKNIFKRWLQSLESKTSYKLTKDKSGKPFGFSITELSWRMNSRCRTPHCRAEGKTEQLNSF